jgi:photosystem II stability/assembly factor-like uncharacterized protein
MATQFAEQLLVAAGTRAGLYIFESDLDRQAWTRRGPYLEDFEISHAVLDPRDGATIWATGNQPGRVAIYRSPDRGQTWQQAGNELPVDQVWHIEPATADKSTTLYAGARPAALYRSDDFGESWQRVASLNEHETSSEWWEGGGGLVLHTIVTNPSKPDDLFIGMSVGGVFYSPDGGRTWEPRNEGVISFAEEWVDGEGNPARHTGVHRCTHKFVRHPDNGKLFQQNHMGVYKSLNYGLDWIDISDGLPDRFGFVIDITRDGTVYVVPQHDWTEETGVRFSGQLAVYRTRDDGATWERLTYGLPEIDNVTLYREGMATDYCTAGGVYFGTSDGQLLYTRDGGDSWAHLAAGLPPIRGVSCEHYSA